jgi:hypothetical protein
LRRIRAGDARAAEKLMRRHKPARRPAVRTRLTDWVAADLGLTAKGTEAADA